MNSILKCHVILILVFFVGLITNGQAQKMPDSLAHEMLTDSLWNDSSLSYLEEDRSSAKKLIPLLDHARKQVESFFGVSFPDPISITVVPDRSSFTAILKEEWGIPQSACWMVATGVADFAVILSPDRWKEEACEHDPDNSQHVQDIITHELTHVYHGQHNPTRDFSGAEEIGWFLEGLTVVVAEQLEQERLATAGEAIKKGLDPKKLTNAWSGKYRYGVSGSLVLYIDKYWGRSKILQLLSVTSQKELLGVIDTTEKELLSNWRRWVLKNEK